MSMGDNDQNIESKSDRVRALKGHEHTDDSAQMYFREMDAVSLLTREGEVEICKRIEEGKKSAFKLDSISLRATFSQRSDQRKITNEKVSRL